ncbi:hypothetical protein PR048_025490 [Dryococelus australis]|uniref:Transposase n=1 Tax=Dryococelus australis TaxID=614101 RepID=A0ABQ9GRG1_9NEOP|nr:hypothetical protein PR048_025490 [Dryococelus australis]
MEADAMAFVLPVQLAAGDVESSTQTCPHRYRANTTDKAVRVLSQRSRGALTAITRPPTFSTVHRALVCVYSGAASREANGAVSKEFLQDVLPEYLEGVPLDAREEMMLQQDGAPPHFAIAVRRRLDMHFPSRWTGRRGEAP